MSKLPNYLKHITKKNKPVPPRPIQVIEQEYTNTAAQLGDESFKQELTRADIQQLTLKMSQLKDEHAQAKSLEPKSVVTEPAGATI